MKHLFQKKRLPLSVVGRFIADFRPLHQRFVETEKHAGDGDARIRSHFGVGEKKRGNLEKSRTALCVKKGGKKNAQKVHTTVPKLLQNRVSLGVARPNYLNEVEKG